MTMHEDRGFTLIEVLVAFAILAVAMVVALQGFTGGIEATRRTEAADTALAAARSLMDRVGPELPLAPGLMKGKASDGALWSIRIAHRGSALDALEKAERTLALYDVTVDVAAPGTTSVSLATVKLGPAR
jgi:general secretion pathway protein I